MPLFIRKKGNENDALIAMRIYMDIRETMAAEERADAKRLKAAMEKALVAAGYEPDSDMARRVERLFEKSRDDEELEEVTGG